MLHYIQCAVAWKKHTTLASNTTIFSTHHSVSPFFTEEVFIFLISCILNNLKSICNFFYLLTYYLLFCKNMSVFYEYSQLQRCIKHKLSETKQHDAKNSPE